MTASTQEKRPVVLFGRQIGRDSAIYAVGLMAVFPTSLLNAIVLTHLLSPGEYGDLGVLFIFAGLLTIVENLLTLQGTFAYVYGASDEEGETDEEEAAVHDKRRAMTTGVVATLAVVTLLSIPLIAWSGNVTSWLIGEGESGDLVVWAVLSAGAGAIWRLSINIFRLERRAVGFAVINALRPVLVLAISVPLVASGHGIRGALIGTTFGTLVAIAICVVLGPRLLTPAVSGADLRAIAGRGGRRVPVMLALWTLTNADLFWLSRFGNDASLGTYRLASRFGSVPSYFMSAYMMAWGPLRRSSAYKAALETRPAHVKSRLITYFVVASLAIVLVLGVTATALVSVAPESYAGAAPLIPLIGLSLVAYGIYVMLNRTARYRHKQVTYASTAVAAAALMGALSWLLIPTLGSYGAILAVCLALLAAITVIVVAIQRGPQPIPFEWRKLLTVAVLAVGAYFLSLHGSDLVTLPQAVFAVVALAGFALGVVALGVLPRSELAPLAASLGGVVPSRKARQDMADRLRQLPPSDRDLLARVLGRGLSVAMADEAPSESVLREVVRALRELDGVGSPGPADAELGEYLLAREPRVDLDPVARGLWDKVPAAEVHRLEVTVERLRSLPARAWS